MKAKSIWMGALLAGASVCLMAATQKTSAAGGGKEAAKPGAKMPGKASGAVARGKYLVTTSLCNDCHTPKKMGPNGPELDMSRELAGHVDVKLPPAPESGPWIVHSTDQLTAWSGPWGTSFAKNLTPDQNTGIGSWSEETFIKAIRTGKHMGVSRPILPPMPWELIGKMTDADLKAIYAYLRTIPAVNNPTPDPLPPSSLKSQTAKKPAGKKP